jgi:alkanesulfonate monooxygenase
VATLTALTGRRIYLNLIAGGFKGDLEVLCDETPHDDRYVRLTEYTRIVAGLLKNSSTSTPLTFDGKYYSVKNLRMSVVVSAKLQPGIFVSGSSDAGIQSARDLNAVAVQYPRPAGDYSTPVSGDSIPYGIRVGIISRSDADTAWDVAHERFPPDRRGQIAHQVAMKKSDSTWHRQLSELAEATAETRDTYWLEPFNNYRTFCPYLVGNYDTVAKELRRYVNLGYSRIILDIPPTREELAHVGEVFSRV